ncbi:MAG: hypothetical protein ACOVRN_07355 [Flavobacterium sp.]
MSDEDKQSVLREFPNIKLSYEVVTHKKVESYDRAWLIPAGKRCFAWFTTVQDQAVCIILELEFGKSQRIRHVKSVKCCFDRTLAYGTILYGVLFYYNSHPFFSIEQVYQYKGQAVKTQEVIDTLMQHDIQRVAYNRHFVVFGLPITAVDDTALHALINSTPYPVYAIHYVSGHKRWSMSLDTYHRVAMQPIAQPVSPSKYTPTLSTKSRTKLLCKPDIQNDVYHLYTSANEYVGVASVPDYKTSVMLNSIFRRIKENTDLDTMEESEDEDEFENPNADKYVDLTKTCWMECVYQYRFKKWTPLHAV